MSDLKYGKFRSRRLMWIWLFLIPVFIWSSSALADVFEDSNSDSKTILVIGSDQRQTGRNQESQRALNDLNLIVHIEPDQQKISVIDLPRDLLVDYRVCESVEGFNPNQYQNISTQRFGIALELGGVECVKRVIADIFQISPQHWILVNFESVKKLSRAVGGVPVCMTSNLIHYQSGRIIARTGENLLLGQAALDFVRERKTIGDGSSLNRQANQQVFIKNLFIQMNKRDLISNPIKQIEFIESFRSKVELSQSLKSISGLQSLVSVVSALDVSDVRFYTLPVKQSPTSTSLQLDQTQLSKLIDKVFYNRQAEPRLSDFPERNLEKNSEGYYCGIGSTRGKYDSSDVDLDQQRRRLDEIMEELDLTEENILIAP